MNMMRCVPLIMEKTTRLLARTIPRERKIYALLQKKKEVMCRLLSQCNVKYMPGEEVRNADLVYKCE